MDVHISSSRLVGAGRGLFAKKDFQPGDVIYSTSRPYVAELDTRRMQDTCAWCFVRQTDSQNEDSTTAVSQSANGMQVKPCGACQRVKYCSKTCQAKSWKREHKYECKAIAPKDRPDLPHGVRAVIKLLGRLKADPEGKDEQLLNILQFQPFADPEMLAAMKNVNAQRFEDFEMLAYGGYKYAGEPKIGQMDALTIAKAYFFNVMTNTLSLSAPYDDISLGMGFDPIVCSANHSCEPNAVVMFNQPQLVVRALRQISSGDEIFIKYIDISNPRSVRRAELNDSYYFNCSCTKCNLGSATIEDKFLKPIDQISPIFASTAENLIQRHQQQLDRFAIGDNSSLAQRRLAAISAEAFSVSGTTFDFNKGNADASEDETRDALKLCLNSGMWDWSRQPIPHLLRQMLVGKIAAGETYQAWRIAAKMLVVISPAIHAVKFYPDRLVDIWTLVTLTNDLISSNLYEEILKGGLDLKIVFAGLLLDLHEQIPKSYGRASPFGRLVSGIHDQFMAGVNISLPELKEAVEQTWPRLEAVGRSVDILNL